MGDHSPLCQVSPSLSQGSLFLLRQGLVIDRAFSNDQTGNRPPVLPFCAMDLHRLAEERSVAYHRAIAERLRH
jgi:hypothetical protein